MALNGMGQTSRAFDAALDDEIPNNDPNAQLPLGDAEASVMSDSADASRANVEEAQAPDENVEQKQLLMRFIDMPNIAEEIDEDELKEIGAKCKREYDLDFDSCAKWREEARKAMALAMQESPPKTYPWPKASNVIYPLLTTASMQFAARAYPAIVNGRRVVKGVIVGRDDGIPLTGPQGPVIDPISGAPIWQQQPGEKQVRADKIGEHMSWQLLSEQPEWEEETDALLHILPIVGCAFRKTYFDPSKGRNASLLVPATNLVINYFAKSVESAPRITEEVKLYPLEIEEGVRAGIYLDLDLGPATQADRPNTSLMPGAESDAGGQTQDDDAPQEFIEQHRWLDLDDDGFPEPYIVTVHKATNQVLRIVARFDADGVHFSKIDHRVMKIDAVGFYTKYDFLPNPEGGIYGIGFGHLLRPINDAVNTSLNMMLDAGHLQNTGGGFIGKSLSMHTGMVQFRPGEYKIVNTTGTSIRESIVPLDFKGPSPVLFQLLGTLIESGKDVAAVKDILLGDMPGQNTPATTTLATIEQGLKVFTGIYKRLHRSMKKEFEKLFRLNRIYLPDETVYRTGDEWRMITRGDYTLQSGVEPVSDPSVVSDMQRLAKAQYLMQFASDPLFNQVELRKRLLDAAQIERPDQLINPNPPVDPKTIIEGSKLDLQERENRSVEIKNIAQAVLFLAQADSAAGDQKIAWIGAQLDALRLQLDAATATVPTEGHKKPKLPTAFNIDENIPVQEADAKAAMIKQGLDAQEMQKQQAQQGGAPQGGVAPHPGAMPAMGPQDLQEEQPEAASSVGRTRN